MTNYLADQNRFSLPGPPTYWLRQLWDFDPSLVVVPSRQECVYRLAQRRPLLLPEWLVNDALFAHSDTKMLASYSLVPITTILSTVNWSNPLMFKELSDRAPWRNGGAEKVIKHIEDNEAATETRSKFDTTARNHDLAKDGWKLYQAKTGQRRFFDSTGQRAWVRGPKAGT